MCDLIDLNSPDRKGSLSSRLASPLIPVPIDTVCNNYNSRTIDSRSLVVGKRDSLENNPFDMVLQKTTEYIQKKDDPFEVTLEKALRLKCEKSTSLRTCSLNLTKDCDLKQKTHKEKLNKTLDESLINDKLNQNNAGTNKVSNDSIVIDLNNTNMRSDIIKSDNVIPTIDVQAVDLSILNQSVMNDTLFELDAELSQDKTKSTLQSKFLVDMEKDSVSTEKILFVTASLKVPKLRRALSQGEALSPKKSKYLNQISLVESSRVGSDSGSNISSANSLNYLNEGFLRSHCSGSSTCSSISNISSIHRINSASSTNNSSLLLSNGTINRTFLDSCSSEKSECSRLSGNIDLNKEIKPLLSVTRKSSISVVNGSSRSSMSDLTDRFNKLKANTSMSMISESLTNNEHMLTCSLSNNIEECITVMEKNETSGVNNKLVDVDIFTPENNYPKEQDSNSISDTSSDSVFIETNNINKSILHEAKLLARTFEELALKTSSGSSIDDLITSNPLWASELLPAFEDEVSIENLIELPISPDGSNAKCKNVIVTKCIDNNVHTDKEKEYSNEIQDKIKEFEMELVEPIHTEKRFTAATLLLDLKKLIRTENNVEANKLLESLEMALGINCENNTELLATCFNMPNNLEKSSQKSSSTLEVTKNVAESNMEHSHENNLSNDSVDAVNFNDANSSKCTAKRKYLKDTCNKSKSDTSKLEIDTDKIKNGEMEKHNAETLSKENSPWNGENNSLLNGRAVIELLANIGKLLSCQTEENPTLGILKNLGNVLNFASNNVDKEGKNSSPYIETQQTPRKSKLGFENKTHSSILSKSTNRLNLDLDSKKQPPSKNFIRRSISVSQTLPLKNGSTSLMSSSKSTAQLKEVTKRFPSDPGFVSPTINKKAVINNHKNELQKGAGTNPVVTFDAPKEKMSAISTVKNKFKKKLASDVVNKKGPMKAMLPVGNMQKREAVSKKIPMPIDTVTPPKTHKFISSTPNSTTIGLVVKKSRSSKPVASSTPDAQSVKMRKIPTPTIASPKKRNFSCDISPVTTRLSVNNNGTTKSPRRNSKLQSPKRTTPKRRPTESSIPKSHTPPVSKRLNSSFDVNQYERMCESPQRSLYKTSNSQKNSPAAIKINENNTQRSPFRDNNKLTYKVKPVNLISKLRRHSVGTIAMEKENNCV